MAILVHEGDLPVDVAFGSSVAVDSETMGLSTIRDRLCVVQLSGGDGDAHLVRISAAEQVNGERASAPNLSKLLADPTVLKLFHFARFDVAMFLARLGVGTTPIYCTKIASKLCRTYTDRHGLKDICRELLGVDLSKVSQSSDWGAESLSQAQRDYAASDVLYLHALKEKLDSMLKREGRLDIAQACFDFVPRRAELDVFGWADTDIFAHS
jgi:ribonuclease D